MYTIYADGLLVHGADREVIDPRLRLEAGQAGRLSFDLYEGHPAYGYLKKLDTIVTVAKDGVEFFCGRVIEDELDIFNRQRVLCEGLLAIFNDSVIRPYQFAGSVVDYIQLILDQHNDQVEADKQVLLGNVTVTDPNDYIVRADTSYPTTWKLMQEKCVGLLGGYFFIRRSGGDLYLDYLADSVYRSGQVIRTGENLLDVKQVRSGVDIATCLIPLGVKDEETGERLGIESVNGGLDYIQDSDAVTKYGQIFRTEVWDDVTLAENLKTKAQQRLAELVKTEVSITIKAADLSMLDQAIDDFGLFEYVEIDSPRHGLQDKFLVLAQDITLDKPGGELVLGKTGRSLTETQLSVSDAVRTIKAEYATNEQITMIRTNMQAFNSLIAQTADLIRLEVSETYTSQTELDTLRQELSTSLEQTSTEFNFNFSQLITELETIDGDTKQRFESLERFIRFVGGSIILGEVGSPLSVQISNERISFMDGGAEVAYITGQALYITSAIIVDNLQVGNHRMRRWGSSNQFTVFEYAGG